MTPSGTAPDIIRDCAEIGASLATVFTANFAEVGNEGCVFQEEIVEIRPAGGVRLIGPGCIGIIGIKPSLALTANSIMRLLELPYGGISVISQPDSLLGTFISCGIEFTKVVSIGNGQRWLNSDR